MKTYTPETRLPNFFKIKNDTLFLAGTIDNGKSVDWQEQVIEWFENAGADVTVFNPRRKDWDKNLKPMIGCKPFEKQVRWETEALSCCTFILFNFLPGSLSPISLMELGEHAADASANDWIIVVCPDAYFRSGNVRLLCKRYEIPIYKDLTQACNKLLEYFTR